MKTLLGSYFKGLEPEMLRLNFNAITKHKQHRFIQLGQNTIPQAGSQKFTYGGGGGGGGPILKTQKPHLLLFPR